jgi:signal transduction histidine kinase
VAPAGCSTATRAVAEMRQLLGTLRATDSPDDESGTPVSRAPQAGVGKLPDLVRELTGDGGTALSLTYREIGRPRELPETVSVSLYRVAQEALTNIRRHSTARTGQVTLRYVAAGNGSDCGAVEIEVIDDGRPSNAPHGSGLGHVGIRERVALHGGETEIGPRPVGGYRVRARFPLKETP